MPLMEKCTSEGFVLRTRPVSEATRQRVQEAAKRLGYVPNKIAGSLASQRVNLVAVIIPSLGNMVFPEVLSGISDVLAGTSLQPVVGVTDYLPEKEEKVLFEMLSWRPSGVIIAGIEHSEASRAMLRQAPNIILVGEIRDKETAEIAVQAALTGHLVFSTLHTNDAPSAVTRLLDLGLEPFLMTACLEGIIAQRLVRRICVECKEPYEPTDEELYELEIGRAHV